MTHRNYGFRAPTQPADSDARVMRYVAVACVLWIAMIVIVAVVI